MRPAPAVTLALLLSSPLPLVAADPGALTGALRTLDGAPLSHVWLTLHGPEGERAVLTGPGGYFRAPGLPAGEYVLRCALPGFDLSPEAAVLVSGATRLDLTLVPARVREHVVVSATRGDAAASTLGMSVSAIEGERLGSASDVLHLLDQVPGMAVARAGGVGLQASAFLRGGESRFARVMVDGVPVNEPGGAHNFGAALPLALDRIEVVRGAASSLYGTDALAGVIQIVTRRPAPGATPGVHAEGEAGGFEWNRLLAGSSGRMGRYDWNLGAQRTETDNQEPNSRFTQNAAAASLGADLGARTQARVVLRFEDSAHGTPGPTAFGRPDLDARHERGDLVAGASVRHTRDGWAHELRLSGSRTDQLSTNPLDSGSYLPRSGDRVGSFPLSDFPNPAGFQNDTARLFASYQGERQVGGRHLLSGGVDVERETGSLGDRSGELLSPQRTNLGLWLQDRVALAESAFLTVGGRLERNDSYGTEAVPRAALAVRVRGGEDATVVKASAGAGIKEPSFLESFGESFFARGNPDLKAERSRTFDLGVEQRLAGGRVRAEAVVFHHDYRDQIAFQVVDPDTFQGTWVNLGRTRARGLELALHAAPSAELALWAEYTLLEGEVRVSGSASPLLAAGKPLLRRPRHQGSAGAQLQRGRASVGLTLAAVGRRADSDFLGLGLTENAGYTRVDARLRVRLGRGFTAFAFGENLADRRYQEVLGFPALGRAVRFGLRYQAGERQP